MTKRIDTIADSKPDPENARKHNARNLGMIIDALQRVVLDAARTLGRRVNWGRSAAQLNRALRSSADQRKMQDILWGAFPNVYR